MNLLVVGSGAREHALAWSSPATPGSPASSVPPATPASRRRHASPPSTPATPKPSSRSPRPTTRDLTIVGPELPLTRGVADLFAARGRLLLGPTASAAELESSKAFAKDFMARHGVPTAAYQVCDSPEVALGVLASGRFGYPVVLKADGLAAGKGVVIATDPLDARLPSAP